MKKLILSILLFVALAGTTFAQKKTVEERAKMATEKMEKDVALNADQKAKIYEANLVKIKATDDLRASLANGEKPTPEQMKPINQAYGNVVKETLTAEQKAKMAEIRAAEQKKKEGTK
jgi:uncharacterized membrane protein